MMKLIQNFTGYTIEEETDRREDKGRRCCLGDVIECRTSH